MTTLLSLKERKTVGLGIIVSGGRRVRGEYVREGISIVRDSFWNYFRVIVQLGSDWFLILQANFFQSEIG